MQTAYRAVGASPARPMVWSLVCVGVVACAAAPASQPMRHRGGA
ncbi:hypothetical protein N644_0808 [Lactiplantibacillus paraplantarum]|nr:hypothetical protein N644_0808 [Lactiplantibacillus paraplantarum]